MKNRKEIRCAMTIAGSDSGGGAGIQADMLTFAANGVFATSAIAAITAQNPDGVSSISTVPIDTFRAQMDSVFDFFAPKVVKTGMLFDAEHISAVADFIKSNNICAIVDPVMISTSGTRLLKSDAENALKENLLPLAYLITPNLDEAKAILDKDTDDIEELSQRLVEKFSTNVLLKGGHLNSDDIEDILLLKSGEKYSYKSSRIHNVDTHGSGCTLSAAIAANIAKGFDLEKACQCARDYLISGMNYPIVAGGRAFINHFPKK